MFHIKHFDKIEISSEVDSPYVTRRYSLTVWYQIRGVVWKSMAKWHILSALENVENR